MVVTFQAEPPCAEHCWHRTGLMLACHPPIYPEVCCHCRAERCVRMREVVESDHGPYAPAGTTRYHTAVEVGP